MGNIQKHHRVKEGIVHNLNLDSEIHEDQNLLKLMKNMTIIEIRTILEKTMAYLYEYAKIKNKLTNLQEYYSHMWVDKFLFKKIMPYEEAVNAKLFNEQDKEHKLGKINIVQFLIPPLLWSYDLLQHKLMFLFPLFNFMIDDVCDDTEFKFIFKVFVNGFRIYHKAPPIDEAELDKIAHMQLKVIDEDYSASLSQKEVTTYLMSFHWFTEVFKKFDCEKLMKYNTKILLHPPTDFLCFKMNQVIRSKKQQRGQNVIVGNKFFDMSEEFMHRKTKPKILHDTSNQPKPVEKKWENNLRGSQIIKEKEKKKEEKVDYFEEITKFRLKMNEDNESNVENILLDLDKVDKRRISNISFNYRDNNHEVRRASRVSELSRVSKDSNDDSPCIHNKFISGAKFHNMMKELRKI